MMNNTKQHGPEKSPDPLCILIQDIENLITNFKMNVSNLSQ